MKLQTRKPALPLLPALLLVLSLGSTGPLSAADAGQVKRGQLLYLQCRACHDVGPSTVSKVGPSLHCLIGRPAAKAPEYNAYTEALSNSGIVWNAETLDKWLKQPTAMVPGTTMATFAGIPSDADRAAIIAYLEQATACDPQAEEK